MNEGVFYLDSIWYCCNIDVNKSFNIVSYFTPVNATFTTNLDLSDAIELTPADDWISAIQDATPGSKFDL